MRYFELLLLVAFFAGCAKLTLVEDWRIIPPPENKLHSPKSLAENARKQASLFTKIHALQERSENREQSENPRCCNSFALHGNAENNKLAVFCDFPKFEANPPFEDIFSPLPADTFKPALPLSVLMHLLLDFYQKIISRGLHSHCPYKISCSHYARKAVRQFGAILGALMAIDRLMRCNRTAADKYFIGYRTDKSGKVIYPLRPCLIDEPANNNIFDFKPREKR